MKAVSAILIVTTLVLALSATPLCAQDEKADEQDLVRTTKGLVYRGKIKANASRRLSSTAGDPRTRQQHKRPTGEPAPKASSPILYFLSPPLPYALPAR